MIKQIFNFRIPSVLGIVLLLLGVGATSYLVDQGIILEGRAAPEKTPANIVITNVTPQSFTVMYTTQDQVNGSVQYGLEKTGTNVALDDRDQQTGRTTPSRIHHITVKNLTPDSTYYFSILSGDTVYLNNNEPYVIKTPAAITEEPEAFPPLTGSVLQSDSQTKQELIALLTADGTQPISVLVAADGSYTLPLTALRTSDLSAYAKLVDASVLKIKILSAEQSSDVRLLVSNAKPVPLITFGENYDFTISTEPLPSENTASDSAEIQFPSVSNSTEGEAQIQILSPEESETFTDGQPVFTGTALPGESIEVTIHSEGPIKKTITATSDGSWEFRPTTPLAPGKHTLTIKTRDVTGTLREFTRSFTVYAQGSQFIEPSVSPTRTPTPTLTVLSPTATATPLPTVALATPTPTLSAPTATPTIITPVSPSPTRPPIAATGSTEVAIGGILGIGTIVLGLVLFFITRGSLL